MITAKCINVREPFSNKPYEHLEQDKEYEVTHIDMGSSFTFITLKDGRIYNSVNFDFYEDGKPLDIYEDKRFNPYLR